MMEQVLAYIGSDEIDAIGFTADLGVEGTWEDLGIRS
jgi:hypothetical protein